MRYIAFEAGADPDGLKIATMNEPQLTANKVRVSVTAFGVNRADTLQRQGKYPAPPGESDILGLEVAGVVSEVGKDCSDWKIGDRVCGLVAGGGYAESVVVDPRHLMAVPDDLTLEHAAGLTEVFLTAWQSLFTIGKLQKGDHALIHAGASGVGLAALQLCRRAGVSSATTASSEEKLALCRAMGADVTINYREQDFVKILKDHDLTMNMVLDFVGGDYLNRNLKILAVDGSIVYLAMLAGRYADKLDMAQVLGKRATIQGSTLRSRSDDYKAALIKDFSQNGLPGFSSGELTVNVDTVYSVKDIQQAHKRLENNDTKGKIIVSWG